jgi:hypothetical protein
VRVTDSIYADGVTDIVVVGPNARLRFHTLEADAESKGGRPKMVPAFTVVMPVEALATLADKLPELKDSLLASGRLRRVAPKPTGKSN